MNAHFKVRDTDRGYRAIVARIRDSRSPKTVTVGVHEAEGSAAHGDDEVTTLDVAAFAEFGTTTQPPRSFIRGWADENEATNRERLRKIGEAIVKGKLPSTTVGLDRFGVLAVADIQKRIVAGIEPENAPSTIERKGSSTPLIDKGQLKTAIAHKVSE
jgi:hypothetical protein